LFPLCFATRYLASLTTLQVIFIELSNIAIDKLQKDSENRRTKKTTWQRLDEVFNGGRGFSIHYFLPTDLPKRLTVENEFE
jgi:hypothetical protein